MEEGQVAVEGNEEPRVRAPQHCGARARCQEQEPVEEQHRDEEEQRPGKAEDRDRQAQGDERREEAWKARAVPEVGCPPAGKAHVQRTCRSSVAIEAVGDIAGKPDVDALVARPTFAGGKQQHRRDVDAEERREDQVRAPQRQAAHPPHRRRRKHTSSRPSRGFSGGAANHDLDAPYRRNRTFPAKSRTVGRPRSRASRSATLPAGSHQETTQMRDRDSPRPAPPAASQRPPRSRQSEASSPGRRAAAVVRAAGNARSAFAAPLGRRRRRHRDEDGR